MVLRKQIQAKWAWLAIFVIAVFVSSPVFVTASQIHFDIDVVNSGQVSWEGDENPLVGTGINVTEVTGLNTPSNSSSMNIINDGLLNFRTGPLQSYSSYGDIHTWIFNGGGYVNVTGSIPDMGIAETTLMSGVFSTAGTTYLDFNSNDNCWFVAFAGFTDKKNEELLNYYGMPKVDYYGNFNISFEVQGYADVFDGFVSTHVLSGDITNHPVPIPASALLLGSGIAGLIGFGKRIRKRVS